MTRALPAVAVALMLCACTDPPPQPTPPVDTPTVVGPSRTKAVRIFVVPAAIAGDATAMAAFVKSERAAANDVFIVGSEARSWVGDRLQPTTAARSMDWETVAFVDTAQNEQLQWQSDADFEITRVEKVPDRVKTVRPVNYGSRPQAPREEWIVESTPSAPDNPFGRLRSAIAEQKTAKSTRLGNSAMRTLRSGRADFAAVTSGSGQLYKLSMRVMVDGNAQEVTNIFVFACREGEECRRRVSPVSSTPNRTKIVRLIAVPDAEATNESAIAAIAEREGLAATDFLIVAGKPKPYVNGKLVDHNDDPPRADISVVFVMVEELEQIQWESNVPFSVTSVAPKASKQFNQNPTATKSPFNDLRLPSPQSAQPVRSGVATLAIVDNNRQTSGQLYKVKFKMLIDGIERDVDPDVYCDM